MLSGQIPLARMLYPTRPPLPRENLSPRPPQGPDMSALGETGACVFGLQVGKARSPH